LVAQVAVQDTAIFILLPPHEIFLRVDRAVPGEEFLVKYCTLVNINDILANDPIADTKYLLRAFVRNLHKDKLEGTDRDYTIKWYVDRIDAFLAGAFDIQLYELALQVFMWTYAKDSMCTIIA
jgi:hypothetical protein